MLPELKKFFEENPLAIAAASSIKNGRKIEIIVVQEKIKTEYTFRKDSGKNVLEKGKPSEADVTFTMPVAAISEIVSTQFSSVGQVGLRIFEKMLSSDEKQKVKAKLNCGILSLMTGGYLGVLTAGGGDVAKFLATKGLGNLGKLKDTISKMKN